MIGTLTLTHLGWFVTSSENSFGYTLFYLDLQALAFRSDIKLDDRHGQAVEFVLIDFTHPITNETINYASIVKLYDDTIKFNQQQDKDKHKKELTSFAADWSIQYKYENGKCINDYYDEVFGGKL